MPDFDRTPVNPSPRSDHPSALAHAHPAVPTAGGLDAVERALLAPSFSAEALRRAVIRYGCAARETLSEPGEMLASLAPTVRRAMECLAPAQRAVVQRWVEWWAIHGWHRAD